MYHQSFNASEGRRIFISLCTLVLAVLSGVALVAQGADKVLKPTAFDNSGKTAVLSVQAVGVQIYDCRADDHGQLKWQFREPLATLIAAGKALVDISLDHLGN